MLTAVVTWEHFRAMCHRTESFRTRTKRVREAACMAETLHASYHTLLAADTS